MSKGDFEEYKQNDDGWSDEEGGCCDQEGNCSDTSFQFGKFKRFTWVVACILTCELISFVTSPHCLASF